MQKKPILAALSIALILTGILLVNVLPFCMAQTATLITSNTTWSKADSPITLQGKALVKEGATLTIEPGVTVNFGNYNLRVEGGATLNARGTSNNPIYFKGNGELSGVELVTSTSWNEQTSSGTIIDNAVIDFAYLTCENAKVSNSVVAITNIFYTSGNYSEVSNNDITGNTLLYGGKIFDNTIIGDIETRYSPHIAYNTIKGSITISGYDNDKPILSHNTIDGSVTQLHACPTLSHNEISGEVTLSGGAPTITYNTLHSGLSLSDKNGTISNNNFLGGEVGIGIGAIFQHIYVTITDNIIAGCTTAGIRSSNGYQDYGDVSLVISGNVIKECNYGVDLSGVTATIDGNLFRNNEYGLIGGTTIQHNTFSENNVGVNSLGGVHNNNFLNNKYGFSMQSPELWVNNDVDATHNWWGTNDKETIKQTLFDYKNDYDLGAITFEPFLTSPDSTAPPISYQPATGPYAENTPTAAPSGAQTITPAPVSSQSTTENPIQPSTQGTILGLELRDLALVLLGFVVTVLAVAIVLILKNRRKK